MRSLGVEPVGESCAKKPLRTMSRLCAPAALASAPVGLSAPRPFSLRASLMRHTVARTARWSDAGEGRLREPVQADAAAAGASAHATVAATMHRVRCRAMVGGRTFADDALIRSDPGILPDPLAPPLPTTRRGGCARALRAFRHLRPRW